MKVNMLKGKIVEKGMTIAVLCEKTGIRPCSFYRKIKGPNEFTVSEITKIIHALDLTPEKTFDIFFDEEVTQP